MSNTVIKVENISKDYHLGTISHGTLSRDIESWIAKLRGKEDPNSKIGSDGYSLREGSFKAVDNVSFEVKQGDVLGIIGRNGAGKSTLLKIISQVTTPSSGQIKIKGRVASLLEVGTGFHPELTGRENIFLNGAILGMTKQEIRRKFDEIVDFAEIEKFIDTPVKRYSSGMYVRLAFAVAAHLEPEILVVDEVLAVGDIAFQKKCLGKMGDIAGKGRTVIFVSHNLFAVAQLCTRGILLYDGQITCSGSIRAVVDTYMRSITEEEVSEKIFPVREGSAANINRVCLRNDQGKQTKIFSNSESITFEIEYIVRHTLLNNNIFILIERVDGLLILKAADDDGGQVLPATRTPGRYLTMVRFPGNLLNEGHYQFRLVIGKRRGIQHDVQAGFSFEVEDWNDYTNSSFGKRDGVLLFPLSWNEMKIGT